MNILKILGNALLIAIYYTSPLAAYCLYYTDGTKPITINVYIKKGDGNPVATHTWDKARELITKKDCYNWQDINKKYIKQKVTKNTTEKIKAQTVYMELFFKDEKISEFYLPIGGYAKFSIDNKGDVLINTYLANHKLYGVYKGVYTKAKNASKRGLFLTNKSNQTIWFTVAQEWYLSEGNKKIIGPLTTFGSWITDLKFYELQSEKSINLYNDLSGANSDLPGTFKDLRSKYPGTFGHLKDNKYFYIFIWLDEKPKVTCKGGFWSVHGEVPQECKTDRKPQYSYYIKYNDNVKKLQFTLDKDYDLNFSDVTKSKDVIIKRQKS